MRAGGRGFVRILFYRLVEWGEGVCVDSTCQPPAKSHSISVGAVDVVRRRKKRKKRSRRTKRRKPQLKCRWKHKNENVLIKQKPTSCYHNHIKRCSYCQDTTFYIIFMRHINEGLERKVQANLAKQKKKMWKAQSKRIRRILKLNKICPHWHIPAHTLLHIMSPNHLTSTDILSKSDSVDSDI